MKLNSKLRIKTQFPSGPSGGRGGGPAGKPREKDAATKRRVQLRKIKVQVNSGWHTENNTKDQKYFPAREGAEKEGSSSNNENNSKTKVSARKRRCRLEKKNTVQIRWHHDKIIRPLRGPMKGFDGRICKLEK